LNWTYAMRVQVINMKTTLFMAMSLNGVIATEDGEEDFISEDNWSELCRLAKKTGNLIWGRKTYDNVKSWEKKYIEGLKGVKIFVISRKKGKDKKAIFCGNPEEALNSLKKEGFKDVLISGGATINSYYLKKNLVNDLIINVEPAIMGFGLNIFKQDKFYKRLRLIKTRKLTSNILQLNYKVLK